MTAEASEAKKYSTSLFSNGWNSEVDAERLITGISLDPCGLCSKYQSMQIERNKKLVNKVWHIIKKKDLTMIGIFKIHSLNIVKYFF